ncbi:hypothetical protein CsSME_00035883 [Camellia sinensis var. sinensis]
MESKQISICIWITKGKPTFSVRWMLKRGILYFILHFRMSSPGVVLVH